MDLNILESARIAVLAPHPDDESIGCGGLLCAYGPQIDVFLLTDGRFGGTEDAEALAARRLAEFESAMRLACVRSWRALGVHDRDLKNRFDAFRTLDLSGYDYVFAPHAREQQKDHRRVMPFLRRMKLRRDCLVAGYEVWTPLARPNAYLDLRGDFSAKRALIACHRSQIAHNDYAGMAEAANRRRGAEAGVALAEAYEIRPFSAIRPWWRFW